MKRFFLSACICLILTVPSCRVDDLPQVNVHMTEDEDTTVKPATDEPEPSGEKDVSGYDFLSFCILYDGNEYYPIDAEGTEYTVFVPDGTPLRSLVAKFRDNAASVEVAGTAQESGVTANNFTSYKDGVVYTLKSDKGKTRKYTVRVLTTRIPALSINTAGVRINSKEIWRDATIKVRNADGSLVNLGSSQIRGRGNWTWEKYPKKPYNFKLNEKQEVLGMPAHKRWVLLALWQGMIGNALAFEATRRAPTMPWAPRGEFVEVVLNGKYNGLYYLCEHIRIDENRMPIAKLTKKDIAYPEVSGGYLLEFDELYDEPYKFKSSKFNLPVQLKAPNDSVPDEQLAYIRKFINDMETEIKKIGTSSESHYADYLDVANFAEYWMVLETVNNYEAYKPRSVKLFKGRDGVDSPPGTVCKLKAGPLWDQEWFLVNYEFNSKNMYYYKYLFQDPLFVQTLKERWPAYKSNILGNERYPSLVEYMNDFVSVISTSAARDIAFWDNPNFTLSSESDRVRRRFVDKINWMDRQINAL